MRLVAWPRYEAKGNVPQGDFVTYFPFLYVLLSVFTEAGRKNEHLLFTCEPQGLTEVVTLNLKTF
jgi:hypothetical protein